MLLHYARSNPGKPGITRPGFGRLSIAACSFVVSVCTAILIARLLAPGAFGIYMFVLWLATAAVPAIGVGMLAVTSRHIAEIQSQEEPHLAAGIFHFVLRRQYHSILFYCLIYILLAWPFSKLFGASAPLLFLLLAGLSALPQLLSGVASITLRSLHRFDLLVAIHLFGTITTLLLVILAMQVQGNLIGILLLISAIAATIPLAMAMIGILRLLPVREATAPGAMLKARLLTQGLNNSLLLFTMDVFVWQRSELLLLTHRHSTADLGFYALSSIISTRVIDIAPALLSTCLLPLLLRFAPGQRYTCASDAFVKTSRYVALLAIPLCAGAIIFCPGIIALCFGNVYLPVVMPLRLLLVASAFGSIATVSLTHLANGERKQAQIKLGIYAASLNILLAVPCIALWGVTGAALACAVAQIVSATGSILICKKLIFG